MVERRDCGFCGDPIEPGTGKLFIKRDGSRFQFCSSKCQKNLLVLKRVPRTVGWTRAYVKGGAKTGKASAYVPAAPEATPTAGKKGGKSASAKAQKFVS